MNSTLRYREVMTDPTPHPNRIRIALLVTGSVLWLAVFALLYFVWQKRQQLAADSGNGANDPRSFAVATPFRPWEVPDFELTECHGKTVRKADLLGRPWVASFLFTRCRGACPRVASQLQSLKDRLGKTDSRLVTFTVDPERDTPEVLKRYADVLQAEPQRWLFLTGKQKDVYDLILHGFKMSVEQQTGAARTPGNEVSHSQYVLLVDAKGFVVGRFDGTNEIDMMKLATAIRKLDAADNGPARSPAPTERGETRNPAPTEGTATHGG
jgi:protein SCO1